MFDGLLKIALAEAEWAGDERALAILDEALATADRTGHRIFGSEMHRTRGEILLTRSRLPRAGRGILPTAIRSRSGRHAQL